MRKSLIALFTFFSMVGIIKFAEAKLLHEYASFPERAEKAVELGLVESPQQYVGDLQTNLVLQDWYEVNFNPQDQNISFGSEGVSLIAGTTYNLAGSGVSGSATSITLQSFTIPQTGYEILDSDLPDTFYVTLEPGSKTRQEIVSCTTASQGSGSTATLSGCSRGILPFSPHTASTTYAFTHGGGTQAILSDPPNVFNEFAGKTASSTITGLFTYASSTTGMYPAGDGVYFRIGDGSTGITNKCIYVHNGDATPPKLCFNDSTNKWLIYNDGTSSFDISAGGSGLTANNSPIYLSSSEIKLATSTSNYVFTLDTSVASPYPLIIATSTISNGKASGKAIEDHWNARHNATTTVPNLTTTGVFIINNSSSTIASNLNIAGNSTTTGNVIIGTTSFGTPTNTLSVIGNSYLQGNATTTKTVDVKTLCFDGDGCVSSLVPNQATATNASCSGNSGDTCTVDAACTGDRVVISGGYDGPNLTINTIEDYPLNGTTWRVTTKAVGAIGTYSLTVYAMCY